MEAKRAIVVDGDEVYLKVSLVEAYVIAYLLGCGSSSDAITDPLFEALYAKLPSIPEDVVSLKTTDKEELFLPAFNVVIHMENM